jgi:Ca-activated chloride channel family protein
MPEEILLDYTLDQPYISTQNVETQIKALLRLQVSPTLRQARASGTHLCLVLDVSSSMRDQEMRELIAAASNVVDLLRDGDVLSLIAFQSNVYEILQAVRIGPSLDRAEIKRKVSMIMHYRGGGTDMELALTKAEMQLNSVPDPSLTRTIVLLTDGRVDGVEDKCLQRAAQISARGVTIDALGFGREFDYRFMQRLVADSNGFTTKIDRPEDIPRVFADRVKSATNVLAQNVRLKLSFTPQVRAGRGYRHSPEMLFLGNIRLPGDSRDIDIHLGNIERDKAYSYVVTFTVPQRADIGPVRAIAAQLTYDIPSLHITDGTTQQSVVVHFTDDPEEASVIHGEVERAFDEVEIGRMVEELERAMQQADHRKSAMFFDVLTKRYTELGDAAMADHYQSMKRKYAADGALTQEDLNYNRHSATQKRDSGVALVDASDLI